MIKIIPQQAKHTIKMNEATNKSKCKDCDLMANCFKNLSDDELAELGEHKVYIKYKRKEIVAKQGSFASHIIFIKSGYLKLYIESGFEEKNLIINVFGPRQLIGLSSLFESNTYKYSVAALQDSELCLFDVADIKKLIAVNPEFAISMIKRSHRSTLYAYQHMYNLTQKQLNGRLASVFIYLSEQVFKNIEFPMILNRAELANFTAMSTMSAVRAINDFKKQGLINDDHGRITILDMKKLEQISQFG